MYTNRNRRCNCRTIQPRVRTTQMVTAGEACTHSCITAYGFEENLRLAQVESPIQEYRGGFCPCSALQMGTYFKELYK
ncbi:MAG: spore coat associated protein CotJA [Clostridia bacterium]|nr:spore coat associated protein CotJA [Clostridia bacterium]